MREPTKKEKNLCEQIAKKYRKKIDIGDWLLRDKELGLVQDRKIDSVFNEWLIIHLIASEEVLESGCVRQDDSDIIPLWTIFDCLEFLRKKGYRCAGGSENKDGTWWFSFTNTDKSIAGGFYYQGVGKTPLEACLKPVLAVVKENKNGKE